MCTYGGDTHKDVAIGFVSASLRGVVGRNCIRASGGRKEDSEGLESLHYKRVIRSKA